MIDPTLFAGVPYGNYTALLDFAGTLDLYLRQGLAPAIHAASGGSPRLLPLGDQPGSPTWLHAVQQTYEAMARALHLPPPPDLESYDLRNEGDFASFMFNISAATRQLRQVAGLP